MYKSILPAFLLSVSSLVATAQATLTGANSNPVVGDVIVSHNCDTTGTSEGASGANITWDFHQLVTTATDTLTYLSCSSTPYCADFPGSNIAARYGQTDYYSYYTTGANNINALGSYIGGTTPTVVQYYVPTVINYPLTYNSSYLDTAKYIYTAGATTGRIYQYSSYNFDSYGTLILPSGTYPNVLRAYSVFDSYDSTSGLQIQHYTQYTWITPGFHSNIANISYTAGTKAVTYASLPTTAVAPLNTISSSLQLFPNPVLDEMNIRFSTEVAQQLHINLTDVAGREVALIGNGVYSNGIHELKYSTTSLAKGLYLFHLQSERETVTRKVLVE